MEGDSRRLALPDPTPPMVPRISASPHLRISAISAYQKHVDRGDAIGELSFMGWPRLTLLLALRSLRDPRTGAALLRVAWRFRRRGWWHRFPFLPLPARDYLRWRMHTAYGSYDSVPPADDVIRFARWAVSK